MMRQWMNASNMNTVQCALNFDQFSYKPGQTVKCFITLTFTEELRYRSKWISSITTTFLVLVFFFYYYSFFLQFSWIKLAVVVAEVRCNDNTNHVSWIISRVLILIRPNPFNISMMAPVVAPTTLKFLADQTFCRYFNTFSRWVNNKFYKKKVIGL